ncbi:hypothetical protein KIN34_02950 [Cellulomonas sp. DKR-3]|uniref:DUF3806 domain-containing protein n=1 Tax=Cellulomonas fulva TaxID=2835530 RepID=A0ABS5TVS1_9CELL|nr:hypothetical protein [Cellulomonas fulva]MBT0993248.1 hypothetical protein [Cellulomonas fulva]
MTDARPLVASTPGAAMPGAAAAGMRELGPAEHAHLDRLRTHLRASGAPVESVAGLGALLGAAHGSWARSPEPGRPDPSPMISAIAVGVGDLVLAGAPGARWVLRVDGPAPSPAVLSADGSAAVVPFADVRKRWTDDEGGLDAEWLDRYVAAASTHLTETAPAPQPAPTGSAPALSAPALSAPAGSGPAGSASTASAPAPQHSPADREPGVPTQRTAASADAPRSHRRRAAPAAEEPVVRYRTPNELPVVPSPEAQNLALRALDRGLSLAMTDGPRPFAMRDDGTNVHVRWFTTGPDEALPLAEAWVADGVALRAAIGWAVPLAPSGALVVPGLGTVPDDESAVAEGADHAVVVLTSDLGSPGLVVAHRYASGAPGRPVGQPLVVGPCASVV